MFNIVIITQIRQTSCQPNGIPVSFLEIRSHENSKGEREWGEAMYFTFNQGKTLHLQKVLLEHCAPSPGQLLNTPPTPSETDTHTHTTPLCKSVCKRKLFSQLYMQSLPTSIQPALHARPLNQNLNPQGFQ